MASLNKVILIGNTGKDPEIRYMPNGKPVASFSIATSESWKDKATGEKKEVTEWHNCTAFDKLAEIIGQYVKKGQPLYVEGRIKTEKYTGKDGAEKYSTKIVVNEMKMLGGGKGEGGAKPAPQQGGYQAGAQQPSAASSFDDSDSSIPF
jgi:single-strand DNA-binding protein